MTASLEAAIFSVPGLGVDDLAAVFTLDSAHTGVTINEIFHQSVLIFAFPLFCCHTLKLAADADHHTSLTYDPYTSQLTLDRSHAGSRADIVHTRSCKVRSQNGALKLRILLDKNSVEVFVNDGEQTMTAWIYTPQSADGITFAADGKATVTAEQFELNL